MKAFYKNKLIQFSILAVIIFFYQKFVSKIGWIVAALFDYSAIDKEGLFMTVSVHHIVMLLISLGIALTLQETNHLDFKLTPKNDKMGIRYAIIYCFGILIYNCIWYIVLGFMLNTIAVYDYELNGINVCGTLGFQLFLSGTAEELMFRALPIVCFKALCRNTSKITDISILLITSILFTIVHINSAIPIGSQLYSLAYVFFNGIIFGITYIRSNSVIYPIIMHGVGNFISVGGCYVYMFFSSNI